MNPTADDHNRIPSLDGLRALSVLIVVVAHAGYGNVVPGGLGVTIFFFLSGYIITTLLLEEHERVGEIGIIDFYLRRVFRLVPALVITLAIAYALTCAGLSPGGISLNGFLAQLFYFANYYALFLDPGQTIPEGTVVLWSLAVEEHFYIFYPLLLTLLLVRHGYSRRRIAAILAGAAIAILAWRFHLAHQPGFVTERIYHASDTRIDSIIYGCILALAFNPMSHRLSPSGRVAMAPMSVARWSVLVAAILTLLATLVVRDPVFRETARYSLQGLALMPIFYFAIRHADRFPFTILNTGWIARLGVYSYAIYLIHYVVIKTLAANAPWLTANRPMMLAIALAICVLYAAAIDRWVDPTFRALRRQFRAGRPRIVSNVDSRA